MSYSVFETVEPQLREIALPARIEQHVSRATSVLLGLLGTLALVAMLMPFVIASSLLAEGEPVLDAIAARPAASARIALGLTIWSLMFALPLRRLLATLAGRRTIHLDTDRVVVSERSLWRRTSWYAPLGEFRGLTHHVRASLSGVRHELILVHPDAARSVLLGVAPKITQADIDRIAALLGVSQVQPSALYRVGHLTRRLGGLPWRARTSAGDEKSPATATA